MYYTPTEHEYVKWESIDKHVSQWQYEVRVVELPPALIPALKLFKLYEAQYPEIYDRVMRKRQFELPTLFGVQYFDYKTRIMRDTSHEALIEKLKARQFNFVTVTEEDYV